MIVITTTIRSEIGTRELQHTPGDEEQLSQMFPFAREHMAKRIAADFADFTREKLSGPVEKAPPTV